MSPPLEDVLDPGLPIIDPHHHLMYAGDDDAPAPAEPAAPAAPVDALSELYGPVALGHRRYLFDDLLADVTSGHDVRATVYVEAHTMYRASGPEHLRLVGEVEYVNGVAAMSASGLFGDVRLCAGIVGGIDPWLGAAVEDVLLAQIQAGGGRFRGVRTAAMRSDPSVIASGAPEGMLADPAVRAAFAVLEPLGLSLDVTVVETQLSEVLDLARGLPETSIVLDHVGFPLGIGIYAGQREERFPIWREGIRALAGCENVTVKLGGLGVPFAGFASFRSTPPATSEELATDWRPYMEACIEEFGTSRCMFESNYPPDGGAGSYAQIWNAFKRLTAGASAAEKTDLFSGTAARVYGIDI